MKQLLAILLSTVLLLACVPLGAIPTMAAVEEKAAVRYAVSGDLNVPKPTKDDIRAVWKSVTHDTDVVYVEEPHTSAPYSTGELTDEFLDNGLTYLNAVRYVAGVPSVQLDAEMNESAQHGAVLLAAVDELTHYPAQPDDMDDDFKEDEPFDEELDALLNGGSARISRWDERNVSGRAAGFDADDDIMDTDRYVPAPKKKNTGLIIFALIQALAIIGFVLWALRRML